MPLSLTPLSARLTGTSLLIEHRAPDGPISLILEQAAYRRLFDAAAVGGLFLGFVESTSPAVLHIFSARALAPAGTGQLGVALRQFLQARQFSRTGSQSEILGYFSSAPSPDGTLQPEEVQFLSQTTARGVRFVAGRADGESSSAFWLRFVNDDRTYLVTWTAEPAPALVPAEVPHALAALSAASQLFAEPADVTPSPASQRKNKILLPALFTLVTLASIGGYFFYRSHSAPPVAPVITAASRAPETMTDPPATPAPTVAANPAPTAAPVTPVAEPAAVATAPSVVPKPASRQLDLNRLTSSTPAGASPLVELPAPAAVPVDAPAPAILGGSPAPLRATPPPPRPIAPPPAASAVSAAPAPVAVSFVPARLVKRASISLAPSLIRTLPPNSQITVRVNLDERSHPIAVSLLTATPGVAPYVANLVAQAVRQWEYQTATRDGQPIPASTNVQVNITRSDQ